MSPRHPHALLRCVSVLGAFLCASLAPQAASAQSLNCNGQLAGTGDSAYSVLQKCGEPQLRQNVCVQRSAGFWSSGPYTPYGPPQQVWIVPPCVWAEDWTYHRGSGNFLGIVRFFNGQVDSVRDGERMR